MDKAFGEGARDLDRELRSYRRASTIPTTILPFKPLELPLVKKRALSASDTDWRKLYIAVGDGGAGEQNNPVLHETPQRLDVLQGKILRISPDDPDGDGPQRYGIPNDNRPENWGWLCPNCHSQTESFAGKKSRSLLS